MKQVRKSSIAVLFGLLLLFFIMPDHVYAAGPIDTAKDVVLTVQYEQEDLLMEGATFHLYKLAEVDEYCRYTIKEEFAGYPIAMDGLDQTGWEELAETLSAYVQRDGKEEIAQGVTDANGQTVFTSGKDGNLKPGLYLVIGDVLVRDGYIYYAKPAVVAMPAADPDRNTWKYETTVIPKYYKETDYSMDAKVLKIWKDEGAQDDRPSQVVVDLLMDGEVCDTVTLNKENNWRHIWTDLDRRHNWTVMEREIDGYTVKVELQEGTFTITNTLKTPGTPSGGKKTGKIPQTGMLWWPVTVFAVLGVAIILFGRRFRKGTIAGLLCLCAAAGFLGNNLWQQKAAEESSREIVEQMADKVLLADKENEEFLPDYILNPDMDMPEQIIDGEAYIATIEIPRLELDLPVNTAWSYKTLRTSPCRYTGSAYTGDLIICAHNYNSHFGNLRYLSAGDAVILTDMDGNTFQYKVEETEILNSYQVEELEAGEWDLTLFTCTLDGGSRVTVRCGLI